MKLIVRGVLGLLVVTAGPVACSGKILDLGGSVSAGGTGVGSFGPGPWLAFDSDRDGTRGIYLIHPDGTGLVRFTTSSFVEKEPAFSPDGTKLAYTSNASGQFQIHVLDIATSTSVQLTSRPFGAQQPAWSPDGSWIAFVGLPQQSVVDAGATYPPPGIADLFVIRPDGTSEKDVFSPSSGFYPVYFPMNPTFAPDSSAIVFSVEETIRAINIDGTGLRQIDGVPTEGTQTPCVSPDGTLVAFSSVWSTSGTMALRTSSFAGDCKDPMHDTCAPVVTAPNGKSSRRPAWGQNNMIAYETGPQFGATDIALVPSSGGVLVMLTNDPADDRNPAWAPSGFNP